LRNKITAVIPRRLPLEKLWVNSAAYQGIRRAARYGACSAYSAWHVPLLGATKRNHDRAGASRRRRSRRASSEPRSASPSMRASPRYGAYSAYSAW